MLTPVAHPPLLSLLAYVGYADHRQEAGCHCEDNALRRPGFASMRMGLGLAIRLLALHRTGVLIVTSAEVDSPPVLDSEVSRMIVSLRERFEGVRRDVMQRVCGRLGNLSSEQKNTIESLTHNIIEKVLEGPMAMLKNACPSDQTVFVLETVRRIFNLGT